MGVKAKRTHASRQASWRLQVRWTGKTMLVVIIVLVVSGIYLAVNARLARAGRDMLSLEARRSELLRTTSELNAELASRTAPDTMMAKATALGFHPAQGDDVLFLTVDGYVPPSDFVAPRPPADTENGQPMLSPAYTETLGDWLMRWFGQEGDAS